MCSKIDSCVSMELEISAQNKVKMTTAVLGDRRDCLHGADRSSMQESAQRMLPHTVFK